MKPGTYIFCRKISGGIVGDMLNPRHQFIVIVPEKRETLNGVTQTISGVRCLVLGAYNINDKLRANKWAPSDTEYATKKLSQAGDPEIQSDIVKLPMCFANGEDIYYEFVFRCFVKYKSYENTNKEIRYPSLLGQINRNNYNSNSWAQSLIFWSCLKFAPGTVTRDFDGLDIGNNRLIPKQYFI